jgi:tetratricopeptide (TPR) repeat protein
MGDGSAGSGDDRAGLPRAIELFQEAYGLQMAGEIDRAIELYRESLEACPTAEAHTFLGWAYSFQGKIAEAISACKDAIRVDPDFGNPYNDIGAYLIELQQLDEAVAWLEQAKGARRYGPRHFPYLNLGRIYLHRGQLSRALEEFRGALALRPTDGLAARAVDEIRQRLN